MGLSFLVGEGVERLEVAVRWGDYRRVEAEGGDAGRDQHEGAEGAGPGREGQGESMGEAGEEGGETAPAAGHADQGGTSGVRAGGSALPARRWCRCPCRRRWADRTPYRCRAPGG